MLQKDQMKRMPAGSTEPAGMRCYVAYIIFHPDQSAAPRRNPLDNKMRAWSRKAKKPKEKAARSVRSPSR